MRTVESGNKNKISQSPLGQEIPMDVPLNGKTRKTNSVRRISAKRRIKPEKNLVKNSLLEVRG